MVNIKNKISGLGAVIGNILLLYAVYMVTRIAFLLEN